MDSIERMSHSMSDKLFSQLTRWRVVFRNLDIGAKLNLGFGILMLVLVLIVALIFSAGERATAIIDLTENVRVPSALASAQAQSNLHRMQAAVRGYLVLSDLQNIDDYNKARERFQIDLSRLQTLSAQWDNPEDVARLNQLVAIFNQWAPIPEQLFKLHDTPLENRPALRIEDTQVRPLAAALVNEMEQLIASQEERPPSAANQALLSHMLEFRNTFQAMTTNLRAYALTGDLAFKFGYADNLVANSAAFTLLEQDLELLLPTQAARMEEIRRLRGQLLELPELIFTSAEGKHSYEDLYLFTTQVAPQAEEMLGLLTTITDEQQRLLQTDLNVGKQRLRLVQIQTLLGGLLSLLLGLGMIVILRHSIGGPVQRLNAAARRVSVGDLNFQIPVESGDEIGRLAVSFNTMTRRLRETIDNLERLYRISQGIMAAQDLSQLVAEVVEGGSIPVINRAVLNVFEFDEQSQVTGMTVIANWYSGQGTPPSRPGTHYSRADLKIIDLLRARQPIFFNDLLNDPRCDLATLAVVERLHIRAMAVLPLWRQDEQIGVLLLEGDQPYEFSEQEIRPYASLLVQLAVAIENRRLFEQTQQRALELEQAKQAAETANRAKSDFLARMSHELRTPLNAILGYAQILRRDDSLTPSQQSAVRVIQSSGEHLLTLINDILDLSRIEAQRLELYPSDFHLASFLEGIVDIFRIRMQGKPNVELIYSPASELPNQIRADEKRLRQVLINLIENAIKFTEEGQVIFRVESEPVEGQADAGQDRRAQSTVRLRFQIADTGIGMSPEDVERIFRPFEQASNGVLRAQGVGLGLAISHHLVQVMGGQLEVQSELGQGSVFTVTLDLPEGTSAPEAPLGLVETGERIVSAVHTQDTITDGGRDYRGLVTAEQVKIMLDLAWKGELPALSRYAQELARTSPACAPLAERVQRMADEFDEEGLLALLEGLGGE
jgi:signal transduction histidine kinase/CHASE3 domain sensor protein/HAMP domain-containing protein